MTGQLDVSLLGDRQAGQTRISRTALYQPDETDEAESLGRRGGLAGRTGTGGCRLARFSPA